MPVLTCSSLTGRGIPELWTAIGRFREHVAGNGSLAANRAAQARAWLWAEMAATLVDGLRESPELRARTDAIEAAVVRGEVSGRVAARRLVSSFLDARKAKQ